MLEHAADPVTSYLRLVGIKVRFDLVEVDLGYSHCFRQFISVSDLPLNFCSVREYQGLQVALWVSRKQVADLRT